MKYLAGRWKRLLMVIVILVDLWLLYWLAGFIPFLDFSQEYRKIQGIGDIVFVGNGWNQSSYKRSFWGLKKISQPHSGREGGYDSDDSLPLLESLVHTENVIRQAVYSPDKRYILYCEVQYGYTGSGVTDDEYCYYRVYDMERETVITIYQAYREWYDLAWGELYIAG